MSKTQFYGAASLDGFLATNEDGLEWLLQFGTTASSYSDFIAQIGAIAMGASTYEWLLRNHIRPDSASPQAWPYEQPSWVFTHHRLTELPGAPIHFVSGDVSPVHADMRASAGDKNVWIVGGGELVGQFWDQNLLDELIVQITPVTLGTGKPLLPRRIASPPLKLISVQEFGGTFAELRYEVPKRTS